MNKILKILCGVACVFVFCFLAIGYAAVQDDLSVNGSLSIIPPNKVFAVYGMEYDYDGNEIGMALNFYNRSKPSVGGEIKRYSADGQQYYGKQAVAEIYEGFDTAYYTANRYLPWYGKDIVSVTVVDEGIAPVSTAYWFNIGRYTQDASGNSIQLIKSINDIGKLDTSNVTSMNGMFQHCSGLTSLDVSGLETENVTNMSNMFRNCNRMTELIFGNFDTSKVRTMNSMFLSCRSLPTLDLSSFDTSSLQNIYQLFNSCNQLTTVYVSDKWNTTITGNAQLFPNNPNNLVGGAGSRPDERMAEYARIDGGSTAPGYFTYYKYSVVFEPNHKTTSGEVVATVPEMMLSPTDNTFTLPAPSHPWATFLGWSTTPTPNENTTLYQAGATFTSSDTAPCCDVLYAIWDLGVTEQSNFESAVEQANGDTVIIGGGNWGAIGDDQANSDYLTGIRLEIYDGIFVDDTTFFYYPADATITINGGCFDTFVLTVFASGNTTIKITGGEFKLSEGFDVGDVREKLKISGGTFNRDPSAYLVQGYIAEQRDDGTWMVNPQCSCTTKCSVLNETCERCKTDISFCQAQ